MLVAPFFVYLISGYFLHQNALASCGGKVRFMVGYYANWVDDYYYDYQDAPPISANSMERMNSLPGGTRNPTVEELIQNGDSK